MPVLIRDFVRQPVDLLRVLDRIADIAKLLRMRTQASSQTPRGGVRRVVCLAEPDPFWAVGSWYRHFEAVTDDEVVNAINAAYTGASLAAAHQQPYR